MNGKPPKFTSPWKTTPSPQFDAQRIYRTKLAPPTDSQPKATPNPHQSHTKAIPKPYQSQETRLRCPSPSQETPLLPPPARSSVPCCPALRHSRNRPRQAPQPTVNRHSLCCRRGVYLEYYGLTEPPFDITPNPRFLF